MNSNLLFFSEVLMEKIRDWLHPGFSVHNEVVVNENDREALVRLAQYVVYASFSSEKIRHMENTNGVIYKSKLHPGKNQNRKISCLAF